MDVSEFVKRKGELEDRISEFVTSQINEFQRETGVFIDGVGISLNVITSGSETSQITFVSTDVYLDL